MGAGTGRALKRGCTGEVELACRRFRVIERPVWFERMFTTARVAVCAYWESIPG